MKGNDNRFLSVQEWVEDYRESLRADGIDPDAKVSMAEIHGYSTTEMGKLEAMAVIDKQNLNRVVAAYMVDAARCHDFLPIFFGMSVLVNTSLTATDVAGILGESIARLAAIDPTDPLERMLHDQPEGETG